MLSDEIIDDNAWDGWGSEDVASQTSEESSETFISHAATTVSSNYSSSYANSDSASTGSSLSPNEPPREFSNERYKTHHDTELKQRLQVELPESSRDRTCHIWILPWKPESIPRQNIFHFMQQSKGTLVESPPVFHPTGELLVWSTGNGEILFVDVKNNTYFMRSLNSDGHECQRNCMILVKATFSPCVQYLHMASVYGHLCPNRDPQNKWGGKCPFPESNMTSMDSGVPLILYLTTHRLSKRKLARSPPRLVYRNKLYFDSGFEKIKEVYEHPLLMFTLTWTQEYLYLTKKITGNCKSFVCYCIKMWRKERLTGKITKEFVKTKAQFFCHSLQRTEKSTFSRPNRGLHQNPPTKSRRRGRVK
jgi:hypothetical protein